MIETKKQQPCEFIILFVSFKNKKPPYPAIWWKKVEPRGVEPLSEDQKTRASPSAVCVLTFPPPDSPRQDSGFSSFIKSHRPQSLRRLVPCFFDADDLRRRRLRVDDRRLSGESYVIVVVSSICFPLSGGSGPPLASLSLRIPVETKIRPRVGFHTSAFNCLSAT